jgi:MOSC domain-containing protein YiiM
MVTHGFDDLPTDPRVMRAVVSRAQGSLGVYATVEEPGAVSVGDAVELLDAY